MLKINESLARSILKSTKEKIENEPVFSSFEQHKKIFISASHPMRNKQKILKNYVILLAFFCTIIPSKAYMYGTLLYINTDFY